MIYLHLHLQDTAQICCEPATSIRDTPHLMKIDYNELTGRRVLGVERKADSTYKTRLTVLGITVCLVKATFNTVREGNIQHEVRETY